MHTIAAFFSMPRTHVGAATFSRLLGCGSIHGSGQGSASPAFTSASQWCVLAHTRAEIMILGIAFHAKLGAVAVWAAELCLHRSDRDLIGNNPMKRFSLLASALTVLLACACVSATAVNEDARALSIARQAQSLAAAKANGAMRTATEFKQRNRLLDAAAALEAKVEAGQGDLSALSRARMTQAIDALQSIPVEHSLYAPKAITANGTLSGTVRDAATGLPVTIANAVSVQAIDFTTQIAPTGAGVINSAFINASGVYTLTLPPGNYHVRTISNNQGYIHQAFGFGNCPDSLSCPRYVGTIVTVPDGGVAPPVDFSMPLGGRISGNVKRSDTMANVPSTFVIATTETGFGGGSATADASGNYTISGLMPGRYRVYALSDAIPAPLFLNEAFGGIPCGDADCFSVPGVSLVTVTGTATTGAIDFTLDPGAASIAGVITESGAGTPIVDDGSFSSLAYLVSEDQATYASFELQPDGSYSFLKLRPGNYRVAAAAPGYIGKVVSGLAPVTTRDCSEPVFCDALDIGAVISLPVAGALTGLNFQLNRGASFSGNVRAAVGLAPIADAVVNLTNDVSNISAITDASGNFTVSGLPAGVYYAYADAPGQNFVTTWLGDVPCRGFYCVNLGVPVTVTTNASISGQQFNMPVGGNLTGVIVDGTTGFPAPRQTRLELFNLSGTVVQTLSAGPAGYSAIGLQPGAYKAVFASSSVVGWVDTAFGGLPCPRGGCDLSLLPTVFVTAGATTSGIGATLPRGPRILGRVTDATTGQPVQAPTFGSTFSGTVAFNNNLSNYAGFASIDGAGNYHSRTGFSPGPYFLSTFLLRNNTPIGGGYVDEIYNNITCPYGSCGLTSGTAINVAGSDLTGFDIALSPGGSIAGTVTNAVGAAALFGVQLKAYNSAGDLVARTSTNPNGKYRLRGLPAGNYFVTTQNALGFQDELFNGQSCEPFCNPVTGTPIVVTGIATTSGRDFALDQSVSVSGTVSDGGPAANVAVEIYGQIGNLLRSTVTTASGGYVFADLGPGRFYVRTRNATGRTDDLYYQPGNPNNTAPTKPDCVGLACQVRRGTPIDVSAGGSFPSANLALTAPGVISGQVTNASTSNAMSGVALELLDARGAIVNTVTSSASGNYSFSALAAGNYYLVSRGTPGFVDEAFPNAPCPASCNGLAGSAITVTAGATTGGINLALAVGGSISGTVRNSANNLPIPGTTVQVYNSAAVPVAQIATNPSGNYELANVADGGFFVRTQNSLGFINEVFVNRACGGYCDILNGEAVTITGGVPVGLVDFSLDAGGSISGQLTNANTGVGIALAEVQAIDINGLIAGRTNTNASGNYSLGGLQPGNYRLRTSNTAGYENQVYRTPMPLTCSPTPCTLSSGTSIAVAGAVTGINLALAPGGTISGTAADLFNNPLPTGTAVLLDSNGIELMSNTIVNGLFEFNGLANGSYYVLIRNNSGLIDLLFPNVPCPAGACNITAAGTPIVLSGTRAIGSVNATANIDLRLPAGRAISGRVTRSGAAVSGVTVYVFNASGVVVGSGVTDALGDYLTSGSLPAGAGNTYFAATTSPASRGAGSGLINKAWNNVPCMLDCGVASVGTAIALPTGAAPLSGINFDLAPGGAVSGTVRTQLGAALALVSVQLFDSVGRSVGAAQSDSLGNYTIDGLVPGTYFARTSNLLGLQDVLFGGAVCAAGCNPLTGTPINVIGTTTTPSIDFGLPQQVELFKNGFE
jgi:hypothetical protein